MTRILARLVVACGVVLALASPAITAHAQDVHAGATAAAASGEGATPHASIHGCPSGSFCFYQNASFKGRMLRFQSCGRQNLTDFGFNDKTSSWVNNTSSSVDVFRDVNAGGGILWHEAAHALSAHVGSANDKASSFRRNC